jgi:dynein light chain Tctex-type 1
MSQDAKPIQPEPNKFDENMKNTLEQSARKVIEEFKQSIKNYNPEDCSKFTHEISEKVVESISKTYSTYKFTVTCIILNKKEGGLHMSSSCYWDATTDGNVIINESNDAVYIIVNVFTLY